MANNELEIFFAHSIELESEAHHNEPVAQFFLDMALEASHHLAQVTTLAKDLALPELKAWEFDWPQAEPPETASYEALHYRRRLRESLASLRTRN